MQERRRFLRFRIPLCVKYRLENRNEEFSAVCRDISYGGIRLLVENYQPLPETSQVSLEIIFPERTLRFSAKLVWKKEYPYEKQEAGFLFTTTPTQFKDFIYKYTLATQ